VADVVGRLVERFPDAVDVLRVARQTWLDGVLGRWMVPDGLIGFDVDGREVLLVVEVERCGSYRNLVRHVQRSAELARRWPRYEVRLLVIVRQVSWGRRATVTDAVVDERRRNWQRPDLDAMLTTPGRFVSRFA